MATNRLIAILEDEVRRSEVMHQEISQRFPCLDCIIFDNAPDMIALLKDSVPNNLKEKERV
jgi:hypothetical protein